MTSPEAALSGSGSEGQTVETSAGGRTVCGGEEGGLQCPPPFRVRIWWLRRVDLDITGKQTEQKASHAQRSCDFWLDFLTRSRILSKNRAVYHVMSTRFRPAEEVILTGRLLIIETTGKILGWRPDKERIRVGMGGSRRGREGGGRGVGRRRENIFGRVFECVCRSKASLDAERTPGRSVGMEGEP